MIVVEIELRLRTMSHAHRRFFTTGNIVLIARQQSVGAPPGASCALSSLGSFSAFDSLGSFGATATAAAAAATATAAAAAAFARVGGGIGVRRWRLLTKLLIGLGRLGRRSADFHGCAG